MRITHLEMDNFRNWESEEFDFAKPRTLIFGENNTGKSSILDAIRFLVTGRCRGLGKDGRGRELLMRKGMESTESMVVKGVIVVGDQTYTVTRSFDGKTGASRTAPLFQVEGWTGTAADQVKAWNEKVLGGRPIDLIQSMLDGNEFWALAHGDAKTILLDLLDASLTVPGTGEVITMQVCEERYDVAYPRRTEVKRLLKAMGAGDPPEGDVSNIETVRTKLAALRAERDRIQKEEGEQVGGAKAATSEYRKVELELAALRTKMQRTGLTQHQCNDRITAVAAELATLQAGLDELALDLSDAAHEATTQNVASIIDSLKAHDPAVGCVFANGIPCKTSKKAFRDAAVELEKQSAAILEKANHDRVRQADRSRLSALQPRLLDEQRSLEQLSSQFTTWVTTESGLEDRMGELQEIIKAETGSDTPSPLVALDERIAKGQAILEDKIALKAKMDAYATQAKMRITLTKELDALEKELEIYGPNGIRVTSLAGAIGRFEETVNGALGVFGYELRVQADPWMLVINGLPFVMLSASEQLRVSIALQCALAVISGFGLVLVDQIDMLMPKNRKALQAVIMHVPLDQAILTKAHPEGESVPTPSAESTIEIHRIG